MKTHLIVSLLLFTTSAVSVYSQTSINDQLKPYVEVLKTQGKDPLEFVTGKLREYDLLIFDDALHTAAEPFDFYRELIKTDSFYNKVKYIFLEAVSLNKQQYLDAYLESDIENTELLYPAFQDNFSGTGWSYKTYFDLLHTVYLINKNLPVENRLEVFGVSNPTYWSEIKTPKDFELFQKTLTTHDFFMYKTILQELNNFKNGRKGIFLTNTRHAYKQIKNRDDELYWNCGTFFYQWHPGKTYSIHFHNVYLYFEMKEELLIKWDRIANGIWDSAFRENGDKPVAVPLKNNVFGKEAYIGNHMLNVLSGQAMYDAYDAVIFLKPLEDMHKTAKVDFIYTQEFKKELKRRYKLIFSDEQIAKELNDYDAGNLEELIEKEFVREPRVPLPQAETICEIDAWKSFGK